MFTLRPLSFCLLLTLASLPLSATQSISGGTTRAESHPGPAIISPDYPKDSRGETVYEEQGQSREHKDQPTIPGEFIAPQPIKTGRPKYPKSLKRAHAAKDLILMGVIAENGDFIDARISAQVSEAVEADVAKAALDAVARWKFHPATLAGKPVAERTKVVLAFRIY